MAVPLNKNPDDDTGHNGQKLKETATFAIRYRNPTRSRTVRASVHTVGRSFELSYRTGAALAMGPRVRTPSLDRADPQDSFKSGDFDGSRALGKKGKEGKFWTPVLKIWHRPC
jgi:hypothetical protein